MHRLVLLGGLLALVVLALAYKNSRFGVESPEYRVVLQDGAFEVREYPAMVLVSTPMPNADVTEGSAFMRLFRYISGSNEADREISMTTPVLTETSEQGPKMSFLVPQEIASKGAPRPLAADVELGRLEGGRFAAYRFSGSWSPQKANAAEEKLKSWMREQGLEAAGAAIIANYDPPFTPSFLRRNEVLVRLAS